MTGRMLHCLAFLALSSAAARADEIPRPEHPNPQLERAQWLNLNGTWEFWESPAEAGAKEADAKEVGAKAAAVKEADVAARTEFPDRIVVPFCRESQLSGLGRTSFVKDVVYRRDFTVPADWSPGRTLLHIGACDWRTVVWVNGQRVGFHEGGSAPITCDVTDALASGAGAKNELRVWAFDDTRSKTQQCGKQCDKVDSYGCLYTRTTGIWQTVWIERVGATYVESATASADFSAYGPFQFGAPSGDQDRRLFVAFHPVLRGNTEGLVFVAAVRREGKHVASAWRPADARGESAWMTIEAPRLWSPADPQLYDLVLSVRRASDADRKELARLNSTGYVEAERLWPVVVDEVRSYFGLRRVDIRGPAVLINGQPVFQRTILDQGFYPDGIWTAPSDAALKRDIELSMAAGFNGARLHQKVFEPRFHYWADKLGYLTWGEAPSWGNDDANPASHRVVLQEWAEILARDRNHPSIVGWCPFNETGGGSGPLQNAATTITRAIDPTRLLLDTSGYTHSDPLRDVDDAHDYDQNPVSFRARWWPNAAAASLPTRYGAAPIGRDRPFFVSEFGGIGWKKPGDPGWGYGNDPKTEAEWYARFQGLCDAQLDNPTLFGFCYTQLTDVEQERNGLYYYDRRPKFDVAKLHAIVAKPAAIEAPVAPPQAAAASARADWKVVLPGAVDDPQRSWMYVAGDEKLAEESWRSWQLAKATTKSGRPGFGRKEGFPVVIGTPWTTRELYLFRLFDWDGAPFDQALLVLHHDEEVTICVNGQELAALAGWNDRYEPVDVTERARALLKPGENEITVHVSQTGGGQYFDAALLVAPSAGAAKSPSRE